MRRVTRLLPLLSALAAACSVTATDTADAGADAPIDPIEVGHSWTYDVTVLGTYPSCTSGSFTATTLRSEPLDGKTAFEVQSVCEHAGIYKYAVEGDLVSTYVNGAWHVSLDAPVTAGHTWSDGVLTYRWDDAGTVTTKAGTFASCWSATTVAAYTSFVVLCRGVGPVHWHYEDGFGNGYDAQLTGKSF
jgi:hypothetical protein